MRKDIEMYGINFRISSDSKGEESELIKSIKELPESLFDPFIETAFDVNFWHGFYSNISDRKNGNGSVVKVAFDHRTYHQSGKFLLPENATNIGVFCTSRNYSIVGFDYEGRSYEFFI